MDCTTSAFSWLGKLGGGFLGGQARTVLHGALDELVLLNGLIGLIDGRLGQIVLAHIEQGFSEFAIARSCLICFLSMPWEFPYIFRITTPA